MNATHSTKTPNSVDQCLLIFFETQCDFSLFFEEKSKEIIGWKKVEFPPELKAKEFYAKNFDAVEPIYRDKVRRRNNAIAYKTKLTELYSHYLAHCKKNKCFYKIEEDFKVALFKYFPDASITYETVEVPLTEKGIDVIDPKTGDIKMQKLRIATVQGVKLK